jgi:general secretion pathway protein G
MKRRIPALQRGFTLIELLIVIVILGLLGSLVAPDLFRNLDKSKQGAAKAQMQLLETSLDTYYLDVGEYPNNLSELRQSDKKGWSGPYLKKELPLDPWGNDYILQVPGDDGGYYTLKSLGRDNQPGGEGLDEDLTSDQ